MNIYLFILNIALPQRAQVQDERLYNLIVVILLLMNRELIRMLWDTHISMFECVSWGQHSVCKKDILMHDCYLSHLACKYLGIQLVFDHIQFSLCSHPSHFGLNGYLQRKCCSFALKCC